MILSEITFLKGVLMLTRKIKPNNIFIEQECFLCGKYFDPRAFIWTIETETDDLPMPLCYECGNANEKALKASLAKHLKILKEIANKLEDMNNKIDSIETDRSALYGHPDMYIEIVSFHRNPDFENQIPF